MVAIVRVTKLNLAVLCFLLGASSISSLRTSTRTSPYTFSSSRISSPFSPIRVDRNVLTAERSNHVRYCIAGEMDSTPVPVPAPVTTAAVEVKKGTSKIMKRWMTGLLLGALGTAWISSGNGPFTLGFFFASLIAQSEYYAMVKATGVEPAEKTGIVASVICFVCAALFPTSHELVMPLSATFLMLWLLVFNKKSASISEISTSLLGMFYVGFLPSFWVRLRALEVVFPTKLPMLLKGIAWLKAETWTFGAIITWWTWLSIVCADVGAYFIGKCFGKHKLGTISAAAGAASPNKTVEGAIGGVVSCMVCSMIGANLMQWPLWVLTGSAYGVMLAVIALVGDLTASMMKRDANMKDSGNILPGHGGLLDRIDSYMFTAPAAFFFCQNVLPVAMRLQNRVKEFPLFFS